MLITIYIRQALKIIIMHAFRLRLARTNEKTERKIDKKSMNTKPQTRRSSRRD